MASLPDSEDAWEYEYDPTKTEELYFTIDLTSCDPKALQAREGVFAELATTPSKDNPTVDGITDTTIPASPDATSTGNLQILELHTLNPVVKFEDRLYDCEWQTDLGTQVFVSSPGSFKHPLKPGVVVDIVGKSNVRLVGTPLKIRRRPEGAFGPRSHGRQTPLMNSNDGNDTEPAAIPNVAGLLEIPEDIIHSESLRSQASFLTEFSRLKAAKKQSPVVRIKELRDYKLPSNVNEIREAGLEQLRLAEAEAERLKEEERKRKYFTVPTAEEPTKKRPRARRLRAEKLLASTETSPSASNSPRPAPAASGKD